MSVFEKCPPQAEKKIKSEGEEEGGKKTR